MAATVAFASVCSASVSGWNEVMNCRYRRREAKFYYLVLLLAVLVRYDKIIRFNFYYVSSFTV